MQSGIFLEWLGFFLFLVMVGVLLTFGSVKILREAVGINVTWMMASLL
jgi:hypothetical protein